MPKPESREYQDHYDDGTGLLTFEAAKVGALPTVLTSPSAINPVWAGANCSHGSYFMYAALAGGTGVNAAQMFWGPTGDGDMNFLSSPNIDTLDPFELPTTQNKQITAQPFAGIYLPSYRRLQRA